MAKKRLTFQKSASLDLVLDEERNTEGKTCGICFEKVQEMRQLTCGHMFCPSCLENLLVQNRRRSEGGIRCCSISCPYCRSVQQITTNQKPREIIRKFPPRYFGQLNCDFCRKNKELDDIWWCKECLILLCSRCQITYHQHRATEPWASGAGLRDCVAYLENLEGIEKTRQNEKNQIFRQSIQQYFEIVTEEIMQKMDKEPQNSHVKQLLDTVYEAFQMPKVNQNAAETIDEGKMAKMCKFAEKALTLARVKCPQVEENDEKVFEFLKNLNPKCLANQLWNHGKYLKDCSRFELLNCWETLSEISLAFDYDFHNLEIVSDGYDVVVFYDTEKLECWKLFLDLPAELRGKFKLGADLKIRHVIWQKRSRGLVFLQNSDGKHSIFVYADNFQQFLAKIPLEKDLSHFKLALNCFSTQFDDRLESCMFASHRKRSNLLMITISQSQVQTGAKFAVKLGERKLNRLICPASRLAVAPTAIAIHNQDKNMIFIIRSESECVSIALEAPLRQLQASYTSFSDFDLVLKSDRGIICIRTDDFLSKAKNPKKFEWKDDTGACWNPEIIGKEIAIILRNKLCLISPANNAKTVRIFAMNLN